MLTKLKTYLNENNILDANSSLFKFLELNSFYIDENEDEVLIGNYEADVDVKANEANKIPKEEKPYDSANIIPKEEKKNIPSDSANVIQAATDIPEFCREKEVKMFI